MKKILITILAMFALTTYAADAGKSKLEGTGSGSDDTQSLTLTAEIDGSWKVDFTSDMFVSADAQTQSIALGLIQATGATAGDRGTQACSTFNSRKQDAQNEMSAASVCSYSEPSSSEKILDLTVSIDYVVTAGGGAIVDLSAQRQADGGSLLDFETVNLVDAAGAVSSLTEGAAASDIKTGLVNGDSGNFKFQYIVDLLDSEQGVLEEVIVMTAAAQ